MLVIDNANDPETQIVVEQAPVKTRYLVPGSNLGCGGGLKLAMREGLQDPTTTHFWIFDDDAEATPRALDHLLHAMRDADADVAVPMILDRREMIGWFPGLLERTAWEVIKQPELVRQDYLTQCGETPVRFSWSTWPSMIVTTRAVRIAGFPRDDFWYQAEDVEFSLRLTAQFNGVFVPAAVCQHCPPAPHDPNKAGRQAHLKNCLTLQNTTYCVLKLPHGRRARKHLPGNFYRFFQAHGLSPATLRDAACAFYWGGICGKPADTPGFQHFKQRWFAEC